MRTRTAVGGLRFVALAATSNVALFSTAAHAQQPVSTTELPAVVVSPPPPKPAPATAPASSGVSTIPKDVALSPTAVLTPTNEVASSVTIVTSKDLELQQRRTVPDALQSVPGLNVVQAGSAGGQTSVFMRGTNSNHVKVFIDGIEVSDPSNPNGSFDFGHLTTADIERIEVLRGPQSGLYGSDALGGVISIVTKQGEGPPKITGYVEGGSFGTFNQALGVSGSEGRFNYSFNVSHLRSMDTPVTPPELLLPGEPRFSNAYDNLTYSTKLGVDVTRNFSLNWTARYTDATLKFTGDDFTIPPFTGVPAASQSTQTVQQFFTRGEAVWSPFGEGFKSFVSLAYTDHINKTLDPINGPSSNDGDRIKTDWRGLLTFAPGQTVLVGVENQIERLNTDTTSAQETNQAGYVELQSKMAPGLFLAANARYDDNETFGGHATWRVAPSYVLPWTDTKLKASIGTGFKAPTLNQRFVDFPSFGFFGNPNLLPEQSLGWDVGFEQPFLNDRIRVGVTYFHNDIKDLIQANFTTYENVGRATTSGYETFAAWTITDKLRVRADYTYTEAIDDITGMELLRRPKNKIGFTTAWVPFDPITLSGTVIYVGERLDIPREGGADVVAPAYTLVNLAGEYKLDSRVALFGRVDNLLNEHYQDPTGFLRPGLGVFGGVRFSN